MQQQQNQSGSASKNAPAVESGKPGREMPPSLVLGTMTFGGQTDEKSATEMINLFFDSASDGRDHLDSAFLYQKGKTEGNVLNRCFASSLHLKIHVWCRNLGQDFENKRSEGIAPSESGHQSQSMALLRQIVKTC